MESGAKWRAEEKRSGREEESEKVPSPSPPLVFLKFVPRSVFHPLTREIEDNVNAIHYFHIDHNAPCLPLRILHNHCFQFLQGITIVPREIENNGYAKCWGVNEVHYGLCKNGELFFLSYGGGVLNVKMVNNSFQFVNEDNDVNVRWKRMLF